MVINPSKEAKAKKRIMESQDQILSMSKIMVCNQDIHNKCRSFHRPPSLILNLNIKEKQVKVKTTPTSLADFCQLLHSRVKEQSAVHCLPDEDQETLFVVIASELALMWPDLTGSIQNPLLTLEENTLLQTQTMDELMGISQKLYLSYLLLLDTLRRRAVFNDKANQSRLGAMMARDCTSLLNVRSIQRNIAMGLKVEQDARLSANLKSDQPKGTMEKETHTIVRSKLGPKVGVKSRGPARHKRILKKEIQEITASIGELDLQRVYRLMPRPIMKNTSKRDSYQYCGKPCTLPTSKSDDKSHIWVQQYTRLKGCNSMPDLRRDTLLDELEVEALPSRPPSPMVLLVTAPIASVLTQHEKKIMLSPAEDLRWLLLDRGTMVGTSTDTEDDVAPLIKALPWKAPSKLPQLTQALQRLEKKELIQSKLKERRSVQEEFEHPQAAVLTGTSTHPQGKLQYQWSKVNHTASRVSERFLPWPVIPMYPPVYNNLTKEIEHSSVEEMDRKICAGQETKDVYEELSTTMSTEHLDFDEGQTVDVLPLDYDLTKKSNERLINPELKMQKKQSISQRNKLRNMGDRRTTPPQDSANYASWFRWWKNHICLVDYLRYITDQDLDYLNVIFHTYNYRDGDDEDERKLRPQESQEEREKRRKDKMEDLRRTKQKFMTGLWNVNTVLLGGLWNEPILKEDEECPDDENMTISEQKQVVKTKKDAEGPLDGELQNRLNRIWATLCLPNAHRMDMAIKYSSHAHRNKLVEATAAWENAARLIQQRESLLARLEVFEWTASDPNRLFEHGVNLDRMNECRKRNELNSDISLLERKLSKIFDQITECFDDTVTFKGRPYGQKMRWDRIEMLYWLQQNRRAHVLKKVVEGRHFPTRLCPLDPNLRHCPGTHTTPRELTPSVNHNMQAPEPLNPSELSLSCVSLHSSINDNK